MVGFDYKNRKIQQLAEYNADQTEFSALKYKITSVDAGIADDTIASNFDDYELQDPLDEEWARQDAAKDNAVGLILEVLQKRAKILGENYPFEINGSELILKEKSTSLVYRFCLAISNAPTVTTGKFVELPRKFELIAGQITKSIFGNEAQWLHTGWPRSSGLPTKFIELAAVIKEKTMSKNEWTWKPHAGLEDTDTLGFKDCGIDYLAWSDFFDQRDGKIFAMGQCACGNDWTGKFHDINLKKINKWFHPMTLVSAVKVLSIPYCAADGYLLECADQDNFLLDRLRLTLLCEKNGVIIDDKDNLENLISMVIK